MDLIPYPPGPRNRFPGQIVFSLRTDTLGFVTRTARRYGDFVAFPAGGWLYVLLNDPDAIREVLVTQADQFIKGPALRRAKDTLGEGLLTSEGEFHRRQRRLSQPAFHPQRVAAYADGMVAAALNAAERWRDGQAFDAHEQMMQITLRIVAKTLFDADVEAEVQAIGHAMDVSVNMFTRAMNPLGPLLNKLPLPSNFRFRRARALLNETVGRFIRERRAGEVEGRNDLLSLLLRARDDEVGGNGAGNGMTDDQLRDESLTIFTAGHETTANALTFAWYLLAGHPEAEAKLHAELDDVLGGRPPAGADVARLPYTRAVLAEAMRLYPPAWAIGREATAPVTIAGHSLPAKTVVLMSQWVTHRDARWWPDPERFDPGRWAGDAAANRPRYAYFPFGGGPRNCIGESFAWTEAILVLAALAARWRLRLARPGPLALTPTITLRPKHGLPVTVHAR